MLREFTLPDLGEGLTESEVVAWRVAVGDQIELNQVIADIETAKAVVELPSPFAGTVAALHAEPGQTVDVGAPLVSFEIAGGEAAAGDGAAGAGGEAAAGAGRDGAAGAGGDGAAGDERDGAAGAGGGGTGDGASANSASRMPGDQPDAADRLLEPNLVGYGAAADAKSPRRRPRVPAGAGGIGTASAAGSTGAGGGVLRSAGSAGEMPHSVGSASDVAADRGNSTLDEQTATAPDRQSAARPAERPRSTPPVRTLARELGVDLESVRGTGERGLITRADVEAAARSGGTAVDRGTAEPGDWAARSGATAVDRGTAQPGGDWAARGAGGTGGGGALGGGAGHPETRIPIKGVRKATAAAMVASAFTAPHVTEFLTVDVTASTELVAQLKAEGRRVNILALTAKAVCIALTRTPELNSRWDDAAQEIVFPGTVNLGIAAATQRGLVVPNIKGAERRDLFQLAEAIGELATTAREGRTQPPELRGGTFTITNIGVFGIDAGTPILNPGEAGILALGAVRRMPWEHHGEIALRDVITLSVSFDHRVVDGEQGSRFLSDVGTILREPARVLAMV